MVNRPKPNPRQLKRLLGIQGWRCFYCRSRLRLEQATRDHVLPMCRGGTNAENLVAACLRCNSEKGDRLPTDEEMIRCEAIYTAMGFGSPRKPVVKPWAGELRGGLES